MLFADVVDVDKPGIFFRLGDATAIAYETIQVVVGDAQYEYDYAKCKYWDLRDCRCASDGAIGSACAVKWKRRRFPQHIKQQHDDALINGINKQRQ